MFMALKKKKKATGETQDGRGINGNYTNFLAGPNWNYN